MKTQRWVLRPPVIALALVACATSAGFGQDGTPPAKAARDTRKLSERELIVIRALRAHPLTAPYPYTTSLRNGDVVLSGRVGTKQAHDLAVRLALASGVPIRDDLVIDTGVAHLAALGAAQGPAGVSSLAPSLATNSPYIYPPPLMGRLDDPFFGFVPPILSFPPWWRRPVAKAPAMPPQTGEENGVPANAPQASAGAAGNALGGGWQPVEMPAAKGHVELTVDAAGGVFLRGVVASEAVGREIVEQARSVPGVTRVETDFQVQPRRAPEGERPPPPPEPLLTPPVPARPEPAVALAPAPAPERAPAGARRPATGPAGLDSQKLTLRVVRALERNPLTAELPVKVRSSDGAVTLSGEVPSTLEAMRAYRAAEQIPGVREIIDRLEFTVPDENHPNPLVHKGRPEDVEPYLAAQIRRHVGDLAHVDRVQARGDLIELRGTIVDAADRERLLAIVRSIPVLHGFRLETDLKAE
jgi:osmotically-inducible protein OsmY